MNFHIMTLFPEIITASCNHSILKRATDNNLINIITYNIRDFSDNKHKKVDDYIYGGGSGMLMSCEPIYKCYEHITKNIEKTKIKKIINMSPRGKTFTQQMSKSFSLVTDMIILCGHYEGIDQRVLDFLEVEEVSIGDYVLTGGELPALVVIDSVARHIKGVLSNELSKEEDSFSEGLLEYPQYTRPKIWNDLEVPSVLLSGNHLDIKDYRLSESISITKSRRPDLYEKYINGNTSKPLEN